MVREAGAKHEHAYLIERARSSRSHCGRQACAASNAHGDFIQQGCVRIKAIDPDTNNERFFCLAPHCVVTQQTENMLNFYGDFKKVPGMDSLPDDLRNAACSVLQAIKDRNDVDESQLELLQTPDYNYIAKPRKRRRPKAATTRKKGSSKSARKPTAAAAGSSKTAGGEHGDEVHSGSDDSAEEEHKAAPAAKKAKTTGAARAVVSKKQTDESSSGEVARADSGYQEDDEDFAASSSTATGTAGTPATSDKQGFRQEDMASEAAPMR